ncbi:MAG TPA: hypothetical protein PLS23_15130 [Phycisphaerae bacterium]|nr:hypothetical protein [Phycisphaerae bacterium]
MFRSRTRLLVLAFGVLGLGTLAVWAVAKEKEEKITIDQVPPAAREALIKAAGGATILKVERENENGVVVYEAKWTTDGVKHEAKVTAEGQPVEEEEEEDEVITMEQVPAQAREALMKLAGAAKITKVEKENEDGTVAYEAEWLVDGKEHSAAVTAEGALVGSEETVDAKDVPLAVRQAAEKRFPNVAKLIFEKETKVEYEVTAVIDGKEHEIELTPGGRVADDEEEGDDGEEEEGANK